MGDINILGAARIDPEACRRIAAAILETGEAAISIFDADRAIEHGGKEANIQAVYSRLRGDFTFELNLRIGKGNFPVAEDDFARAFARCSASTCAIDTADGNPFTWILFGPDADERLVTIGDDFRILP
ncbi:hypothetical protein [Sphingomonas colocasiae]|uniref:Uncharacterized protein n=1 Tax=Sphingomonas colocasiae TaxID=1848973 RepID=A0ABS7PPC5_9SPHN|nr:hypothetical protein [Sphingomonas colocasiae]MBY8821879.1 hypothetical protein [Sphingomonas colocasiae]